MTFENVSKTFKCLVEMSKCTQTIDSFSQQKHLGCHVKINNNILYRCDTISQLNIKYVCT